MCFKIKTPSTPTVQQPQVTARELVPSTESNSPEAPVFGGNITQQEKTNKKGREALKIKLGDMSAESNSPYSNKSRMLNY